MIDYVFYAAQKLSGVQYAAGDEISYTPRKGDWLISQGAKIRRKDPAPTPIAKTAAPVPVATPKFARTSKWGCCGWK